MRAMVLSVMLALAGPAAGQPVFLIDYGHWVVTMVRPGSCMAVSKPMIDYHMSPYNSLELHLKTGEAEARVTANFWPGAFAGEGPVMLSLMGDGSVFEMPARSRDGFAAVGQRGLSREEFRALRRSSTLAARAEGVDAGIVGTGMQPPLVRLLEDLRSCVRLTGDDG